MSDTAIRVEGLGKQFRIGAPERYRTLRDALAETFTAPARWLRRTDSRPAAAENFWALKDVSFEVKRGEVIGVIGRNGAGKSTLLKILSRITEPTEGFAEIHGRVGSLLEVGTGFHPELTGRENIFLNGAILGMKKAEILRKFDEIVAFAEVEKFIDTPVKHFSSGMYMRLAFAVAAHLEPEILIVDEVLAVGDAQFQKKCLGKIGDVAREGRTVVFVSHQLNQLRRLCETAIWLQDGSVEGSGSAAGVIASYENSFRNPESVASNRAHANRFVSWTAEQAGREQTILTDDSDVTIRFRLQLTKPIARGHHGIALYRADEMLMWGVATDDLNLATGEHEVSYHFPILPIPPGSYRWQVSLFDDSGMLDLWDALPLMSVETPVRTHQRDEWGGILNLHFSRTVEPARLGAPQC